MFVIYKGLIYQMLVMFIIVILLNIIISKGTITCAGVVIGLYSVTLFFRLKYLCILLLCTLSDPLNNAKFVEENQL